MALKTIDQLCTRCGLCCDSTLFADVELRPGDDAGRLEKLGLALWDKGKGRRAFSQPCACLQGGLCRIYAERPKRCRQFDCGLLKRVAAGEMTAGLALRKISAAKRQAAKVRDLLAASGQHDGHRALAHRYSELMGAPVDLSAENEADRRGGLMLAVNDLMQLLRRDFLQ